MCPPVFPFELTSQLISQITHYPKSLHSLRQVHRLSAHLTYWGQARVVDTIAASNKYRVTATASLSPSSQAAKDFDRDFSQHFRQQSGSASYSNKAAKKAKGAKDEDDKYDDDDDDDDDDDKVDHGDDAAAAAAAALQDVTLPRMLSFFAPPELTLLQILSSRLPPEAHL